MSILNSDWGGHLDHDFKQERGYEEKRDRKNIFDCTRWSQMYVDKSHLNEVNWKIWNVGMMIRSLFRLGDIFGIVVCVFFFMNSLLPFSEFQNLERNFLIQFNSWSRYPLMRAKFILSYYVQSTKNVLTIINLGEEDLTACTTTSVISLTSHSNTKDPRG